jgi:hypothetical protein
MFIRVTFLKTWDALHEFVSCKHSVVGLKISTYNLEIY